jgi:hypothetical protein
VKAGENAVTQKKTFFARLIKSASAFLIDLIKAFPGKIQTVLANNVAHAE